MCLWWLDAIVRWLRRPAAGPVHVQLFTRPGCCLCDDAWQFLLEQKDRYGFQLDEIDIEKDEDLRRRFGEQVPVVAVNGKVRFRGRINPVLFHRLLKAHARSP